MQGFLFLHILRGRSFTPRLLEEKKTKRPFNMQNRVVVASPPSSAAPLLIMAMQNIYQSFQRKKCPLTSTLDRSYGILFTYLCFYIRQMIKIMDNTNQPLFLPIENTLPQRNFFWKDRSSHQILKNLAAYPFFSRQASLVAFSHHIFTD